MSQKPTYPNIDMQRTGKKIKHMIESAGYTPRIIQGYLHLSCVPLFIEVIRTMMKNTMN